MEKALAERVKLLSRIFYGLTANQLRRTAFEFAEKNGIQHRFNKEAQMAGKDWLVGFLKRNHISVRKPEATSISRVVGFNRIEVARFFCNLQEVHDKFSFTERNIWNMDETGITTVQEPGSVVAEKGQKRVGSITSWERGKNVTVVCAMSSAGQFVPPMFIFPRQRMTPMLEKNGPPGSIYHCSKTGWTTEELFLTWLKHFASFTNATVDNKILLILDSHTSHCTLEAYEFCNEHGIIMVSLPPHCSHRLQPLDVTFFGPLKASYRRGCDLFMKSKKLQKITPYDIAELFNKAYSVVATMAIAISGFQATGIHPLNPNIFTNEDFLPEDMLQNRNEDPSCINPPHSSLDNSAATLEVGSSQLQTNVEGSVVVSVQELCPIPSTSQETGRKRREKQHSEILTSSQNKIRLIEKKEKKIMRNEKQLGSGKNKTKSTVIRQPKRINRNQSKQKTAYSKQTDDKFDTSLNNKDEKIDDNYEDGQGICVVCGEFGKEEKLWFRCVFCGLWAHKDCTDWDSPENYHCDDFSE